MSKRPSISLGAFTVDLRINGTRQTGAVRNSTYRGGLNVNSRLFLVFQPTAERFKAKGGMRRKPAQGRDNFALLYRGDVEQEVSTAAGTKQLPAERAGIEGEPISRIQSIIRDRTGKPALQVPVFV